MKYSAFLSYSHRDNRREGNTWADWLHRALEEFQVPKALAGTPGRYGEPVPARLYPVFQDEKELPTEADLGEAIRDALSESRYLVVICSPNAARSRYVNEEILTFKRLGRANRILALIVSGEPNASDPQKAIDPALECFPEALRHPLDDSGQLDRTRVSEPIAADVRDDDGSEIRMDDERHRARLEREKLRVAAGLLGVGFDTLVNRDRERALAEAHARASRFRKLAATFAVLALAAVGAGVAATIERNAAEAQRNAALHALSRSDMVQAMHLVSQRDDAAAVAYLVRSLRSNPANAAAATRLSSLLISRRWLGSVASVTHGGPIRWARFSPDGKKIVTGSEDHTARVWDVETGRPITPPLVHGDAVGRISFSPDGARIVTTSADGTARVWNAVTGQPLTPPLKRADSRLNDAEFSPDGTRIVTASSLPYVADVMDASTGKILFSIKQHGESLFDARYTRDGRRILTLSSKRLQISDAQTGAPLTAITIADTDFTDANLSPDGTRIVTTSWRGGVQIWDAAKGRPVGAAMKHDKQAVSAEFSPDGRRIVTASWDRTARIWDAATGLQISAPMLHGGALASARFSPDGKWIVTAATDFTAIGYDGGAQEPVGRLWDAETGEPVTPLLDYGKPVYDAQFNPAGTRILTISGSTLNVWDATTDVARDVRVHQGDVATSVTFSPDGGRIASASADKTARVWDSRTGKQIALAQHDGPVVFAVFDPSGTRLLTGSATARLWSAATGQPYGAPMAKTEPTNDPIGFFSGAFSPDGTRVVTGADDGTARVWDAATGQPLTDPLRHGSEVEVVRFSPDGTRVLTAGPGAARLWDAKSGKPVWVSEKSESRIQWADFNGDGTRIVTMSGIRAQIWDSASGKLLLTTAPHDSDAYFAVFSPDSRRLATSSKDKTARIWSVLNGQPVTDPLRHEDATGFMQFSPDSQRLMTASFDGSVRIWDVESGQLLADPFKAKGTGRAMVAALNSEGTRVAAAAGDGVHVWDIAPAGPPPSWMLDLAGALAGRELDDQGVLRPPTRDPVLILDDIRKRLTGLPDDSWTEWGRWLLASSSTRAVSPLAAIAR